MKKMNKMYEAPTAEVIEMQMPVVLAQTVNTIDPGTGSGMTGGGGSDPAIPGL